MRLIKMSLSGSWGVILLAAQVISGIQAVALPAQRKVHHIALLPGDILNLGVHELESAVLKQEDLEKPLNYKNITSAALSGAFVLSTGYVTYVYAERVRKKVRGYSNLSSFEIASKEITDFGDAAVRTSNCLLDYLVRASYPRPPKRADHNLSPFDRVFFKAQQAALLTAGAMLSYKYLISPVLSRKSRAVNWVFHMMNGLDVATLERAFEVIQENANQICQIAQRGNAISPERTTVVSVQYSAEELGRDIFLYRGLKLSPKELTELLSNKVYVFSKRVNCKPNH